MGIDGKVRIRKFMQDRRFRRTLQVKKLRNKGLFYQFRQLCAFFLRTKETKRTKEEKTPFHLDPQSSSSNPPRSAHSMTIIRVFFAAWQAQVMVDDADGGGRNLKPTAVAMWGCSAGRRSLRGVRNVGRGCRVLGPGLLVTTAARQREYGVRVVEGWPEVGR
jgi:hypothetical protein